MTAVPEGSDDQDPPLFCSLGMFIIDTIEKDDGTVLHDVIGGAGTYAAVGSRIFSGPGNTAFVVDYGYDCTLEIEKEISAFQFNLITRRDKQRKCTRGLNTYRGDNRDFQYLTPKLRIVPDDLPRMLLRSRSFHLICTPERCIEIVDRLENLRQAQGIIESFSTIWEPAPDSCKPAARSNFDQAMKRVSILSPNALEAAGILGRSLKSPAIADVESMASDLLRSGAHVVVIRCSSQGSYVLSPHISKWFPAAIQDPRFVVDATGAGNTFCGALATVCASGESLEHAMTCASVAAGLAIEQIGLPRLAGTDSAITWNGYSIADLLKTYDRRREILK